MMAKLIDPSLAEATTSENPDEPKLQPDEFDLEAWLDGVGPMTAEYPLGGRRVTLRARTPDWAKSLRDEMGGDDAEPAEYDIAFLAGHLIGDERKARAAARKLREKRRPEFAAMVQLALDIDYKPEHRIDPRFLPGASA